MSWVKSISRRGKNTKSWISRSAQVFGIKQITNCLQCSACVQRWSNPISHALAGSEGGDAVEGAFESKGLASQCKAQEKYKERLDLGLTWLKWLPTGMESKTRLAPRSNKVNSQKLTLDWNTSLCYRVIWKWHQSAFHANNHAIGGGSNGIIHLGWRPHTFLLHTNIDSTNSNTNRTNITEMAFKRFAVEIRLLLLKKCSHWKRWSTITSTGRTD